MIVKGTPDFASGATGVFFNVPGLSYIGARRRRSPQFGNQWVLMFQSAAATDLTQMSAAEAAFNLTNADFIVELDAVGPVHNLTVITPDDPSGATSGVISTTFELMANSNQLDMREHTKALALGPQVIKVVDAVLANEKPFTEIEKVVKALFGNDAAKINDAKQLYNLQAQRRGAGSVIKSEFVLRATYVTANNNAIAVAYANKEKIHTTQRIMDETGPPTGILASINEAVTTSAPTEVYGYEYGWLKQAPSVTHDAGNKVRITQEYWLAHWSTWLYPVVS